MKPSKFPCQHKCHEKCPEPQDNDVPRLTQLEAFAPHVPAGRVPRISRVMALAIRFEHLIQTGPVADYAELARLGHSNRSGRAGLAGATEIVEGVPGHNELHSMWHLHISN